MKKGVEPRTFLLFILGGCIVGSLIGIGCLIFDVKGDMVVAITGAIIKVCIGIIILIIDLLFGWALIRPFILESLEKSGITTAAEIVDVRSIPHPKCLHEDEWVQKARFSLTIRYRAGTREIVKELDPTALTSKQELYPVTLSAGESIPVKYHRKFPSFVSLDVEILRKNRAEEIRNDRLFIFLFPIAVTAAYIFGLMLL